MYSVKTISVIFVHEGACLHLKTKKVNAIKDFPCQTGSMKIKRVSFKSFIGQIQSNDFSLVS